MPDRLRTAIAIPAIALYLAVLVAGGVLQPVWEWADRKRGAR